MSAFVKTLRPSLVMLALCTLVFGGIYPALSTLVLQGFFPAQAAGSLIYGKDGVPLGSRLIGQNFSDPKYFWGRLSATAPFAYDAAASAGSSYGPANPALHDAAKARAVALRAADPENARPIPVDLVTSSASGLDPHISLAGAYYQVARVARARSLKPEQVYMLVNRLAEPRQFGFLGEPRVNVLMLNLALDGKIG